MQLMPSDHNLSEGSYSASKHLKRVLHKIVSTNILISEQVTDSLKMMNNDLQILNRQQVDSNAEQ
jgi:hypothetical protein